MDSPVAPRGSFEDEGQKLTACEENLRRYRQLSTAEQFNTGAAVL
jgi:hypothetical protein